ncbi:hypothetical protein [Spirosoma arcticum]
MNELLKREIRVAFHPKSQPVRFRILKYVLLGLFVYFYWNSPTFWWIFGSFSVAGVSLHFFYRYKTHGWTRSYGRGFLRWDHELIFGNRLPDEPGLVDRERRTP